MSEETLESFFAVRKHESHDFCHQLRKADYEGVPWLDVRTAVESPAGREMSISGPMLNLTLAPGEVHRFPDPDDGIIEVLLGDTSSLQCQLLSRQYAGVTFEGLGPLDQVDLETYLRLWFKAGATGGQIKGGKFENGYN
ncbi:MAG TPA: hypothetical protein VK171_11785 [Fimbriimonas sp.]|nr:hypothetical protein [Fimbriimonas sp.]